MNAIVPSDAVGAARPRAFATLSWLAKFNVLLVAALAGALTLLLWPHWRDNPDLSHGYFMPVIFLLLLHEARRGSPRYLFSAGKSAALAGGLIALGFLALCASGLYAATLDWSHALVAFTLTAAFACFLGAAVVAFASDRLRGIPLNWSAGVAVGLWLLSAPIPPGTYTQLTLRLQLMVTENVLRALHLLGVAATRQGNVIELATTAVGVEEACSGVRSLVSCLFAGLFFSATLVRRPWARVVIIGLAAPLAIAMNIFRSLALTLLANSGVNISGAWHDLTGFAVLGVTAILLGGLALLLERRSPPPVAAAPEREAAETTSASGSALLQRLLAGGLCAAVALAVFFFANTRPSIRQGLPVPDLAAILPAHADGWRVETARDLYQFSATLQTDHLFQRTYLRPTSRGVEQITVYLAYWRAGQAPVSLVASHTPDACWPGSGWTPSARPPARETLTISGRALADAESRLFENGQFPQYVWFWHLYDGRPIAFRDPYSARALLAIAWRYGFTHDGDQLFVRISSNRPWPAFAREPLLNDIFSRLQPLGL